MKQVWKRLLAGVLTAALLIAVLPGQALVALLENSRSQNEYILEQLQELWGDDVTAEQALALLRQYGLVDSQGNVVTDWSDELYLEEDPQPLTLAEAAVLEDGAVTVNGHAAQARDVAGALARLEGLGLFDGAALFVDIDSAGDGGLIVEVERDRPFIGRAGRIIFRRTARERTAKQHCRDDAQRHDAQSVFMFRHIRFSF